MKIRDQFNFLKEQISIKLVYYVEKGYRINEEHSKFFYFIRERLQKAIDRREMEFPLSSKTMKQILREADFTRSGFKRGYDIIYEKIIDSIIVVKAIRGWEVTEGFRPIVLKMKIMKSKAPKFTESIIHANVTPDLGKYSTRHTSK